MTGMSAQMAGSPFMLGAVFSAKSDAVETAEEKASAERVQKLLNRLSKISPIGKQVVDKAIENGVEIYMNSGMDNRLGTFYPGSNSIALNKEASDAVLLGILVHESRHADQPNLGYDLEMTTHSSVAVVRAAEADAMAHECAAIHQMKKAEPETYNKFCETHKGIMDAYEKEFLESKDITKSVGEAFKAWYDHSSYVARYDEKTIEFMDMGHFYSGAYKKHMPAEEIVEKICKRGDKPYIEPEFIYSERGSTISEEQAKVVYKAEKKHVRNMFKFGKIPTSADKFFIKGADGTITPPKPQLENPKTAGVSLKKAAQQKGR